MNNPSGSRVDIWTFKAEHPAQALYHHFKENSGGEHPGSSMAPCSWLIAALATFASRKAMKHTMVLSARSTIPNTQTIPSKVIDRAGNQLGVKAPTLGAAVLRRSIGCKEIDNRDLPKLLQTWYGTRRAPKVLGGHAVAAFDRLSDAVSIAGQTSQRVPNPWRLPVASSASHARGAAARMTGSPARRGPVSVRRAVLSQRALRCSAASIDWPGPSAEYTND